MPMPFAQSKQSAARHFPGEPGGEAAPLSVT